MLGARLEHARAAVLWFVVLFYVALVVHDFFHSIDRLPYLALDEEVAGISHLLATEGRYGDWLIPIQPGIEKPRHLGFFNYGPWYFYLGGALVWLFGYSLVLLRSIHLWVIVLVCLLALAWHGRSAGRLASALFVVTLTNAFDVAQWPMIRPDPLVSLFAVVFVVTAGKGMLTGRALWWGVAGLAASCGAFTHLLAWTLVPACALVWAICGAFETRHRVRRQAVALVIGVLSGVLMFYASFGFRVSDHLSMLFAYPAFVRTRAADVLGTLSPLGLIREHLRWAYGDLPRPFAVGLAASWLLGWLLLVMRLRGPEEQRRRIAARLLPPLAVWTLYTLSLAAYPNFHAGYTILQQVMGFWTSAAVAMTVLELGTERPQLVRALALVAWTGLLLGTLGLAAGKLERVRRASKGESWVRIPDWIDEVLDPLPRGAWTWGTAFFGIEVPGRVQLVQFNYAAQATDLIPPGDRARITPDYVIWGYPERLEHVLFGVPRSGALRPDPPYGLHRLARLFPESAFELVSLVDAPPYGVTRVYARGPQGSARASAPMISLYDPLRRQWCRTLGAPQGISLARSRPLELNLSWAGRVFSGVAVETLLGNAAPGDYLVHVRLTKACSAGDFLTVTASDLGSRQNVTELGPNFDAAPCSPWEADVLLVHRHRGGRLLVSRFGASSDATISAVEVLPVLRLPDAQDQRLEATMRRLPEPASWIPAVSEVSIRPSDAGGIEVQAEHAQRWKELVRSPPITVLPGRRARFRLPLRVEQGSLAVGVLDANGKKWLAAPAPPREEYEFGTGRSDLVYIVVTNGDIEQRPDSPSRFYLGSGALTDAARPAYVELLMDRFVGGEVRGTTSRKD